MATQGKPELFCTEKGRLLAKYVRSVNEWSDTVRSLSREAGAGSSHFQSLMVTVDSAKALANQARADYAEHVAEHGC
jgi:hypothetical protein